MSRLPLRVLTVFLGVLSLGVAACSGDDGDEPNLFSLDAEWALGARMAAEVDRQVELVDDPRVDGLVDRIGADLVATTSMDDRPWSFSVIRDPSVNAFALPGGHIYINDGLLRAVDDESELAGVLAHEVAHVEARHGTELLTRSYGISFLIDLVSDGESRVGDVVVELLGTGTVAKFSRDAEREADEIGVQRLAGAGWPPGGLAAFLETLLAEQEREPGLVDRFFASHPGTGDRVDRTRELAGEVEPAPPLETVDGRELQEAVDALAGP